METSKNEATFPSILPNYAGHSTWLYMTEAVLQIQSPSQPLVPNHRRGALPWKPPFISAGQIYWNDTCPELCRSVWTENRLDSAGMHYIVYRLAYDGEKDPVNCSLLSAGFLGALSLRISEINWHSWSCRKQFVIETVIARSTDCKNWPGACLRYVTRRNQIMRKGWVQRCKNKPLTRTNAHRRILLTDIRVLYTFTFLY